MADSDSLGSSPSSTPHQASGHQTKVRPLTSKLTYGVLSDTHGSIPSEIYEIFQGVQCIFHCGDIGSSGQIAELETLAPLLLVRGNMDWNLSPIYEESLITSVEFGTVAMAHGTRHGHYNESIIKGLMHQFGHLQPRVMMFGHSHVAFLEQRNGIWLLNPGSPSHPRAGLPTVALIEYDPKLDEIDLHHVGGVRGLPEFTAQVEAR